MSVITQCFSVDEKSEQDTLVVDRKGWTEGRKCIGNCTGYTGNWKLNWLQN